MEFFSAKTTCDTQHRVDVILSDLQIKTFGVFMAPRPQLW